MMNSVMAPDSANVNVLPLSVMVTTGDCEQEDEVRVSLSGAARCRSGWIERTLPVGCAS